jgi:hypothetical protein
MNVVAAIFVGQVIGFLLVSLSIGVGELVYRVQRRRAERR